MNSILLGATFFAAYLIGGIPFGYLVARARGVDIFKEGSGNIGATNVGRVLGKRFGILVFLLDFAKGAIPTAFALWLEKQGGGHEMRYADTIPVVAGLCAFLGHIFPPYLRFRGGKGVATGAGAVSVLVPGPAVMALLVWVVVVAAARYVSLASVLAVIGLFKARWLFTSSPFADENLIITAFCLVAAGLVIVKHRANLGRLIQGTENRLPESAFMTNLNKSLHLLALGLWFGAAVFFSFGVAPVLFSTFEGVGQAKDRPNWFALPPHFALQDAAINGPKDQGTRAAGRAVEPIFPIYFLLQGICGLVAVVTCLGWTREQPNQRVHRARLIVVVLALAGVLAGWPLEQKVSALRDPRHAAVDRYLAQPTQPNREAMENAKREFGAWHLGSLGINLITIVLVGVGLALAARMPSGSPVQQKPAPPVDEGPKTMAGDEDITIRTKMP